MKKNHRTQECETDLPKKSCYSSNYSFSHAFDTFDRSVRRKVPYIRRQSRNKELALVSPVRFHSMKVL